MGRKIHDHSSRPRRVVAQNSKIELILPYFTRNHRGRQFPLNAAEKCDLRKRLQGSYRKTCNQKERVLNSGEDSTLRKFLVADQF